MASCAPNIAFICAANCPARYVAAAERTIAAGDIRLISVMDHTPGYRQFVSLDKFKEYYLGKKLILPEKIDEYIADKIALQSRYATGNKAEIMALVKSLGIRLASQMMQHPPMWTKPWPMAW